MQFNETFRAMDTDVDILVECPSRPLDAFLGTRLLFEQQEQRFSRFRPASLLSALNRGETVDDCHVARACRLAIEAHEFTAGMFNPMVLPALSAAGYSTTFREVNGGQPHTQPVPDPAKCIAFDGDRVTLREGALDLGGIVKGWTVDLALEGLRGRYPDILVNAGGDLRCSGTEPGEDHGWLLAVEGQDGRMAWEGTVQGAMATSSTRRRRWKTGDGRAVHHLIDPRSGQPAESPFEQVTVWARETWLAECWAKAVLIGGHDAAQRCREAGLHVLALGAGDEVLVSRV